MRRISLLMTLAVLGGCGANVTLFGHTVSQGRQQQKETAAPVESAGASEAGVAAPGAAKTEPVVRDVLLSLNAPVRKQVADDARFDSEGLHAAIATELRSRGFMGPPESTAGTPIDILIDAYSLQATTDAALSGRVPSAGSLSGLVRVLDESGREQRNFKVLAEATLQIAATGKDPEALSALYRKFAEQVAAGLATE